MMADQGADALQPRAPEPKRRIRPGSAGGSVRRHRIASRVALVTIFSAALGALAAAAVAIVTVDQLLSDQADHRLRAATLELAGELDEDEEGESEESVTETLDDENSEIAASGIRLAVFEGDLLVAGSLQVPATRPGRCETRGLVGARLRACARAHRSFVLVAAQPSDAVHLRSWYLLAAVGALILGATTGAALSVGLTRWAVGPLQRLARALRQSQPQGDKLVELGPPSNCDEVEAVRSALQSLMDQIQLLLDQARRFAADAAHELRTPLTTLRAELELLSEETSGKDHAALERACSRVSRLSELVERLLVLALPQEKLSAGFETVAIADIVGDVVSELGEQQRARLRLEPATEGLVRGDAQLLSTLVTNAVQNALKFAPEGLVIVRIESRPAPGGAGAAQVVLEVIDAGPGVAPELRERVFLAFYRARPHAGRGHGLGLALIGHIARVHGGRAEFLNTAQGARLCVALPAWTAAPA
jgi:two-component system OmpR family sensor kinase